MQERTVRFQNVAVTRATVQLAPQAAAGMAVGAEVIKPYPALIVTAGMRAEVLRGVDGTRASLGRRHGVGSSWRLQLGMVGIVCAQSAMRSLGETHKRVGLVGP